MLIGIFAILLGWIAGHFFIWCEDMWPKATKTIATFLIASMIFSYIL